MTDIDTIVAALGLLVLAMVPVYGRVAGLAAKQEVCREVLNDARAVYVGLPTVCEVPGG